MSITKTPLKNLLIINIISYFLIVPLYIIDIFIVSSQPELLVFLLLMVFVFVIFGIWTACEKPLYKLEIAEEKNNKIVTFFIYLLLIFRNLLVITFHIPYVQILSAAVFVMGGFIPLIILAILQIYIAGQKNSQKKHSN